MSIHDRRRILLADGHAVVRHGLALMLAQEGVGECLEVSGREEAINAARSEPPDVALVDLSLDHALELLEELHACNVPVLICSMLDDPGHVRRAMAAGARGYVTKTEAPHDLARAVRDVLAGWLLISPRAAEGLR